LLEQFATALLIEQACSKLFFTDLLQADIFKPASSYWIRLRTDEDPGFYGSKALQ
jgi:hypothetical protein